MKYKVIIRQKAEKQLNKQNFVKGKITKYECISFAIIFIKRKLIYEHKNYFTFLRFLLISLNYSWHAHLPMLQPLKTIFQIP